MNRDSDFLIAALLLCGVILFIMYRTRRKESRNERLISFLITGFVVCSWTLLDTAMKLTTAGTSPLFYTLNRILATLLPFSFVWYFLSYTGSRLAQSRIVKCILVVLPALDILVLVTNPLHKLYYDNYTGLPHPAAGPYLWIHALASYAVIITGTLLLFRYIIKNVKKNPVVLLPGISILIPYTLNILNIYNIIRIPFNAIPLAFCVTFIMFIIASSRVKYFNLTNAMITDIFETYKDGIILVGRDGIVLECNNGIRQNFPFLVIHPKKTGIRNLLGALEARALEKSPETLFEEALNLAKEFAGGTFTLISENTKHIFELRRNRTSLRDPEAGYSLTLQDISGYLNNGRKETPEERG
jgi:hypothetical protein